MNMRPGLGDGEGVHIKTGRTPRAIVTGGGYFWPGWVMAGWGILLALHVWDVFWRRPITETDIDEEVSRSR